MDTGNLKNSFNETKEKTGQIYSEVKDKLEETGEKIKDKAEELFDEGREQFVNLEQSAAEYGEQVIDKVRERPVTSLLVAAGVGFLLSKLLK